MEIAIHSPRASYYCGGTERYVQNMARYFQKFGEEITFITYDAPQKSEWFSKFEKRFRGDLVLIKSKILDKKFKKFKKATSPKTWDKESLLFGRVTRNFYEFNKFDVISIHYTVDSLILPKISKTILHLHGVPDKKRKIESVGIKIPDKIIAVSKYIKEGWKKLYGLTKKINVIHNGIDLNIKFPKYEKDIDILFFGRLIKIKGVDTLIKAVSLLLPEHKNIKIKIIGEGPEKNNLIKLSKRLGVNNNIEFAGYLKDFILRENIVRSKICIFPSFKREGVMTTLLEASLGKCCVLASNACSIPEYIKNNFNGLLFNPQDYKGLSEKIRLVIQDKNLRNKLGCNAYKTVKEWSWEKQAKKLLKIYKS